jgi:hypothetical protein
LLRECRGCDEQKKKCRAHASSLESRARADYQLVAR